MKIIKRFLGIVIVLISIPIYRWSFVSLLLVAIFGWTSDSPQQPTLEHLYIRFVNTLFFISNVSLSLAGIQIFHNKIKVFTYLCLIFGLWSAVYFYGSLYSHYASPYSRLQRGNVTNPVKYYSKIIRTEGKEWVYKKRGEIYYGMGEYEKALSDFKRINEYMFMILTYIKLNDLKNAFDACNKWANVAKSPRPYVWKGNLYYKQGNYELAIKEYFNGIDASKKVYTDHAGRRNGATTDDYIRLANCSAKLGKFSLAEQYIDQAFSIAQDYDKEYNSDSDILDVLVARGNLYKYMGDLHKAKIEYSKALQKNRFLAVRAIPKEILIEEFGVLNSELQKIRIDDRDPTRKIYNDLTQMDEIPSW